MSVSGGASVAPSVWHADAHHAGAAGHAQDADFGLARAARRALALAQQEKSAWTRADLVKHHLDVLWHDYFKPEHLEKYPDLHDIVWGILKLAGKTRQEINMQFAQDLLAQTQKLAEIFWDTKGVKTKRVPSNQGAAGGELVVPA